MKTGQNSGWVHPLGLKDQFCPSLESQGQMEFASNVSKWSITESLHERNQLQHVGKFYAVPTHPFCAPLQGKGGRQFWFRKNFRRVAPKKPKNSQNPTPAGVFFKKAPPHGGVPGDPLHFPNGQIIIKMLKIAPKHNLHSFFFSQM